MALIELPQAPTPLTDDQIKAQEKEMIQKMMLTGFLNVKQTMLQIMNRVWNNQRKLSSGVKLSPQDMMNLFGVDAAALFQNAAAVETMLNTAVPNSVDFSAPYNFTVNQDGTVTIGAKK